MKLTASNYYSQNNARKFWSVSQYKDFLTCEARAIAVLRGEYTPPQTIPLLVGSYIDSYFDGTIEDFKKNNPLLYTLKNELRAPFKHANTVIEKIKNDELFLKFLSGEKQKIFIGNIAGIPWKIKIDSYIKNKCIVDLKTTYDVSKIAQFRYDFQGAVYQEIVFQNTGKRLPFYLAVAEKKRIPVLDIYQITQDILDNALKEILDNIVHFNAVKNGEIMPTNCGKCEFCRKFHHSSIKNYNLILKGEN